MKNRVLHRLFALVSLLVSAVLSSAALPDCTPTQPDPHVSTFAIEPAARQRQSDARRAMSLESIEYSLRGPVEQLRGNTGIMLPADIGNRTEGAPADDVLRLFADILLANGTESLTVGKHREHYGSERSLMLTQSIRGIPVLQGGLAVSYDAATMRATSVTANFVPDRDLPRAPRLSAKQAERVVPKALAIAERIDASGVEFMDGTRLGYYADRYSPEPVQLVWVVQTGGGWEHEEFYVDAMTGIVAYRRPLSLSIVGRHRPAIEVTGARCECAGKSISPPKPMRRLPGCGRLLAMNWPQMPGVDRYVGQMALPELGWVFSDLVIDGSSPQCACEVPRTSLARMRGCNSCGCGPWSKGQLIEVKTPCPPAEDLPAAERPGAGPHASGELMFDHVVFGVSDYAASKAFFLKALEPLGVVVVLEGPLGLELSPPKGGASLCMFRTEEKPAHLHLAFTAENRRQVEAFYRAALEAGGKDNGAPGLRPHYHANYYAAFVIGPDGHNIEVVCHEPED